MNRIYTTRDEAIEREIIAAIENSGEVASARDEYDIDAIAEAVIAADYEGASPRYTIEVDEDEFWAAVAEHALGADELAIKANSLTGGSLVHTQGMRAARLYRRAAEIYRDQGQGHRATRMEDLALWAESNYQP